MFESRVLIETFGSGRQRGTG